MAGSNKTSNVVMLQRLRKTKLIKKLSSDDLLTIIKTDNYAHLDDKFKRYLSSPKHLFRDSSYKYCDRVLEESIEGSSAPSDSMFYLTFAVTIVGDVALALTTGALGLTMIYGVYNYFNNKKHALENKQDNIHHFQLGQLQLLAADVYINRIHKHLKHLDPYVPDVVAESKPVSDVKSVCRKVMGSFMKGLNTGTTLMIGYYLSAMWLFEAIELAAVSTAMLTPVGLGVAIGVALIVGIYCGYRHYKTTQANDLVDDRKAILDKEVLAKRDECHYLAGFKRGFFHHQKPLLGHSERGGKKSLYFQRN